MIVGHAPVILPALASVKLFFGWPFYAALAAVHASPAVRLFWGATDLRDCLARRIPDHHE